jgi:hypothetical protein
MVTKGGGFFARQGYPQIWKRVGISFLIFTLLVAVLAGVYYIYLYSSECEDQSCFQEKVLSCDRAHWIREDAEASWRYRILKSSGKNACIIDVDLIQVNYGNIEAEKMEGKSMRCEYQKGETRFPEEDVADCTGELKEALQDIIITRLYDHVSEQLDDIRGVFGGKV